MPLNANFSVEGSSAVEAHAVAYGQTVDLALLSNDDVRTIAWSIASTSHASMVAPTISLAGTPTGATASFPMVADPGDGEGRAVKVKLYLTGQSGATAVAYRIVGVRNAAGIVPVCVDEELDRNATHGWVAPLNTMLAGGGQANVRNYGALGDGVTDDTAAIQAAIDACVVAGGGVVYFPPGVYMVATTLTLPSNVTLRGEGAATLRASASLADGTSLLQSETISGTLDVYENSNSAIEGLTFDGNDRAQTSFGAMVRLYKYSGLKIRDCVFKNHRYILLALAGSRHVRIDRCEFTTWGKTTSTSEGGPAIWSAQNLIDNTYGYDIRIRGCSFHDGRWVGVYAFTPGMSIVDNDFRDLEEAGIYGQNPVTGADTRRTLITGNHIRGVVLNFTQAAGIEYTGQHALIAGNHIEDTEGAGIILNDGCRDVSILGNTLVSTKQVGAPFSLHGQITVRITDLVANVPQDIRIANNRVHDPNGLATYGIRVYRASGSKQFARLVVEDNDVYEGAASAANNLSVQSSALGEDCVIRNNLGFKYPTYGSITKIEGAEDFLNVAGGLASGWEPSVLGASAAISQAGSSAVSGRVGVVGFSTGTDTTGRAGIRTGTTVFEFGLGRCYMRTDARLSALSDGTDTYTARVGFGDSITGEHTDGAFFRYTHGTNSGKWECVTISNGTETATDSGVAVAAATWYSLEVDVNAAGTSVAFYINGALVATNTTNIPTGNARQTGMVLNIIKSAGTTARSLFVDFVRWVFEPTTPL